MNASALPAAKVCLRSDGVADAAAASAEVRNGQRERVGFCFGDAKCEVVAVAVIGETRQERIATKVERRGKRNAQRRGAEQLESARFEVGASDQTAGHRQVGNVDDGGDCDFGVRNQRIGRNGQRVLGAVTSRCFNAAALYANRGAGLAVGLEHWRDVGALLRAAAVIAATAWSYQDERCDERSKVRPPRAAALLKKRRGHSLVVQRRAGPGEAR